MRQDKCLQTPTSLDHSQNRVKSMVTVDLQAVIGIELSQMPHEISLGQVGQEFLTFE